MDVNKLIKEIEAGIKQSIDGVKKKAAMVAEKADELTEEGKKQYRLFELKNKREKQSAAAGKRLYALVMEKKMKATDKDLKALLASLAKTITEIDRLEGKVAAPAPRTGKKSPVKSTPRSRKKSTAKKTVTGDNITLA